MTYDGFRVERTRDIARITLDVPGKLNRVSMLARDQLRGVFEELDADAEVRFVVLGGAGGAFTPALGTSARTARQSNKCGHFRGFFALATFPSELSTSA